MYHDEESWEDGFKYYDGHSLLKLREIEGLRDDKAVVNYLERTDLELMKNTIIPVIYFYDIYENHKYYNNGEEIVVKV